MKKYILLFSVFCCLVALGACSKGHPVAKTPITGITQKIQALAQFPHWSGYYFDTTYFISLPGNYRSITDTTLFLMRVSETELSMPGLDRNLAYIATDSSQQVMNFASTANNLNIVHLVYYYNIDSLSYTFERDNPTEAPWLQYVYLSTH